MDNPREAPALSFISKLGIPKGLLAPGWRIKSWKDWKSCTFLLDGIRLPISGARVNGEK